MIVEHRLIAVLNNCIARVGFYGLEGAFRSYNCVGDGLEGDVLDIISERSAGSIDTHQAMHTTGNAAIWL